MGRATQWRGRAPTHHASALPHAPPTCSDAAHTVHPLAGQGLNLGIGDAEELSRVLIEGAAVGRDTGAVGGLAKYEATRQDEVVAAAIGMDAIKRVFLTPRDALTTGNNNCSGALAVAAGALAGPWGAARALGMAVLNASPQLKAAVAHVAMTHRVGPPPPPPQQ